ncbi:MAG: amidohydrolase family protein [Oscillospiraceae bacterium]|nr:amidohydrolase family protein [Oscillospiraceae bacterium]
MKIIDAHIHYQKSNPHFDLLAQQAGHENTEKHLRDTFAKEGICRAIVMSNLRMEADGINYPPDFLSYCAGIGHDALDDDKIDHSVEMADLHLQSEQCVGLKIYAGYSHFYLDDPVYAPFYELAQRYAKPVAVHMGVTAHARALLEYAHPMMMDRVAVAYPKVQFVMCHFGNPWLMDAAAVLEKNHNVAADLSGLIAGNFDVDAYMRGFHGYVEQLKTWIHYVENYDKFMFGTDWPLTNFGSYISLFKHIIPWKHHEGFFYGNAARIYGLGER